MIYSGVGTKSRKKDVDTKPSLVRRQQARAKLEERAMLKELGLL